MSITIKEIDQAIPCQALSIRTTNQAEANPQTAKIGAMWQKFYQNYFTKLPQNINIYGIYCHYESDANGEFDVIAGFEKNEDSVIDSNELFDVTIPQGKYLVFSEEGTMPDAVITAWQTVWECFDDANCKHTRLYDVDFEHYVSESQVDVYIGIE
ncbi:GyrI-like domain-containing protein [Psychrobacter sp.]|uniref:GyrI-like domain-containing protein n=1 Tax=Psychrobacter sp. TaxID=56811 RepID=UPI0025D3B234|nr:GyrI-like domain-containing protein [Psychrobacter sp.]